MADPFYTTPLDKLLENQILNDESLRQEIIDEYLWLREKVAGPSSLDNLRNSLRENHIAKFNAFTEKFEKLRKEEN